jgi:hypothetical protein
MSQWIVNYVKGCATCQQNKILMHKKKMLLYWITTKEGTCPFQQIAMDLITGLLKHNGKDVILTIVDHGCSRAAVFLPCTTMIIGPDIAQLYMDHVYKWFGLPTKVISNQDPTSCPTLARASQNDWESIKTCHPCSTCKLMEYQKGRTNGVEQYLCLVTSTLPDDWTQWLAIMMMVHNNWKNETTGLSPNQILLVSPTGRSVSQLFILEVKTAVLYMQDRLVIRCKKATKTDLPNNSLKATQVGWEFGKQHCSPVLHKENKLKACVSVIESLIYKSGSRVRIMVSHDAVRQYMRQCMYTGRNQHVRQ